MRDPRHPQMPGPGYSADVLGISSSAFTLLRDLIAERAGVFYGDEKRDILADKLSGLVTACGLTSFVDYYYHLRYDADAPRYWAELMDHLAVPETYFWRQPEQVLAVANVIAPEFLAQRRGVPLRIWSAACCTGEEPLSIAIALAEAGLLDRERIEIVASDGSTAMVERARRGVFSERSFRNLPMELRARYFSPDGSGWRIDPGIHGHVRWTTANLVDPESVTGLTTADVIFCRNVFIYFSDETITRVVASFARGLRDGGHLFLGAAESLARLQTAFTLAEVGGAFVYVKGQGSRASRGPGVVRDADTAHEMVG